MLCRDVCRDVRYLYRYNDTLLFVSVPSRSKYDMDLNPQRRAQIDPWDVDFSYFKPPVNKVLRSLTSIKTKTLKRTSRHNILRI